MIEESFHIEESVVRGHVAGPSGPATLRLIVVTSLVQEILVQDIEQVGGHLGLAHGHRWLAMLESGEVKSLREIARKEGVDSSYVNRMVNLTTLAPDIVAAILDETLLLEVTLFDIAVDPSALWEEQRSQAACLS